MNLKSGDARGAIGIVSRRCVLGKTPRVFQSVSIVKNPESIVGGHFGSGTKSYRGSGKPRWIEGMHPKWFLYFRQSGQDVA
mmetsp:Transcript_42340/g.67880  ORF Transcript_42340/g.67880 Transcript_42340/m.67880 type:complete len:81 (+) Transcript_42340:1538-1780(+)